MSSIVIFIQLVGLVALLLDVFSVQLRLRRHILLMQIAASLTWVTHFLLLGAVAGGVMNAVGALRTLGFYLFPDKRRSRMVLVGVIGLTVVVTILFWRGYTSLMPMVAMIVAVFAFWQPREQNIRRLLLVAAPIWFSYNFIFGSYAGMLSDTIAAISLVIALYRHRGSTTTRQIVSMQEVI